MDLDVEICQPAGAASGGSGLAIVPAVRRGNQRKTAKMLKKLLPAAAQVSVDVGGGGSPWEPWVLMDVASKAVAVEASAANFEVLHDVVQSELAAGTVKRTRYGASTVRPQPKGPAHARQYAVGRTWVTKIRKSNGEAVAKVRPEVDREGGRRPYDQSLNVRTLKRFRTDEAPLPHPAKKRRSKAKNVDEEPVPLMDCLET